VFIRKLRALPYDASQRISVVTVRGRRVALDVIGTEIFWTNVPPFLEQ
jgi:hypothetical protein